MDNKIEISAIIFIFLIWLLSWLNLLKKWLIKKAMISRTIQSKSLRTYKFVRYFHAINQNMYIS